MTEFDLIKLGSDVIAIIILGMIGNYLFNLSSKIPILEQKIDNIEKILEKIIEISIKK